MGALLLAVALSAPIQVDARRLLATAPGEAFGLVLAARESGAQSRYAPARLERLLGRAPNARELRDLDHYFNAFESVRAGSLRDFVSVAAIVAGYSTLKWLDQRNPYTDLVGLTSAGRWSARAPGTSAASWDELLAGWRGAFDGYRR